MKRYSSVITQAVYEQSLFLQRQIDINQMIETISSNFSQIGECSKFISRFNESIQNTWEQMKAIELRMQQILLSAREFSCQSFNIDQLKVHSEFI